MAARQASIMKMLAMTAAKKSNILTQSTNFGSALSMVKEKSLFNRRSTVSEIPSTSVTKATDSIRKQ